VLQNLHALTGDWQSYFRPALTRLG
jgi:hypothetical protein